MSIINELPALPDSGDPTPAEARPDPQDGAVHMTGRTVRAAR